MKKVCNNWRGNFPSSSFGSQYFDEFAMRAQNVGAVVHRVNTSAEAQAIIIDIITSSAAKKVVATPEIASSSANLAATVKDMGLELYTEQSAIRTHADTSDIGIAKVEFGIAETGSVCEDGLAIEQRLITTLPNTSIVILQSSNIAQNLTAAFEAIAKVFNHGYISFITGPSRTSDIERVLTIGVHGPSKFIIIAVDEENGEV
jgi:L-lactate dehydrogenase complex protein LldG